MGPLLTGIARLDLDYRLGRARVETITGKVLQETLDRPPHVGPIESVRVLVQPARVTFGLLNNERITIPLDPQIFGRAAIPVPPTVYLDQNHWINLARVSLQKSPRFPDDEAAVRTLIGLARAGKVALPVCVGRVIETTNIGGGQRQRLARAQLELSAGWTLRHVLDVRETELHSILKHTPGPVRNAISLGPSSLVRPAPAVEMGTPARLLDELTKLTAFYATFLEDVALATAEGTQVAWSWAKSMEATAHEMAASLARPVWEDRMLGVFISDLDSEVQALARADPGLVPSTRPELVALVGQHLSESPGLEAYYRLMRHRLRNASDRWESNDLVDMTSLTCASAYCDVVVAESKMANLINASRATDKPCALVVAKIGDLKDRLTAPVA